MPISGAILLAVITASPTSIIWCKGKSHALGLKSLPVMFGVTTAAWICVIAIDVFQIGISGYLVSIHENLYATIVFLLVIPQIVFQDMYLF
ncbi:MAG: hypothetical protein WBM86_19025 [Waterburya sp.]